MPHLTDNRWSGSAVLLRAMLLTLLGLAPAARAQETLSERPFAEGEVLAYQVSLGRHGRSGTGWLRVESTQPLREEPVVLLRFDFETTVGPFHIQHHSRSWLSTRRLAALRYEVDERFPFSTLTLTPGLVHRMDRHFDARRNPVTVRVLRREVLRVLAGEFSTVVVEMEVRDPERFGGRGMLLLHLTEDARRLPVRIESRVPVAGQLVLELERPPPPDIERRVGP
jgi:Protein of unknown function (DUF3108)